MRRLWRGIVRTIFWSYERGSWPYDLMVVLILLFVLLTPARWFHDQPQSSAASGSGIILIFQDEATHTRIYRIDAKLFSASPASQKTGPELERKTHEILSQSVEELKARTFQVRSIEPIRASDSSVLYYQVQIKQ